jgi:hypothetical protein
MVLSPHPEGSRPYRRDVPPAEDGGSGVPARLKHGSESPMSCEGAHDRTVGRRKTDRIRRRIPCGVRAGEKVHRGIILDLSAAGLFVQTPASFAPGSEVVIEFSTIAGQPAFKLRARVARRRKVPQELQTLENAGLGLRLIDPPPEFRALLTGGRLLAGQDEDAPDRASATPPPPLPSFRVRMRRSGSPRSRTLLVQGADEAQARRRAQAQVGDAWELLEVEAAG